MTVAPQHNSLTTTPQRISNPNTNSNPNPTYPMKKFISPRRQHTILTMQRQICTLTLTLKCGPNPNPNPAMSDFYIQAHDRNTK